MALMQLKKLKPTLDTNFKSRVNFVVLCLTHQLTKSVIGYEYYDSHFIGEREFDTCFEMGDAIELSQKVIEQLGDSAASIIDREMGQGTYHYWLNKIPQKSLF